MTTITIWLGQNRLHAYCTYRGKPYFRLDEIINLIRYEQARVIAFDGALVREEEIKAYFRERLSISGNIAGELVTLPGFYRIALGMVSGGAFDEFAEHFYENVIPSIWATGRYSREQQH